MSPQSLLYKFHSILMYNWAENFENKFTNFKWRKNSPARAWQVYRVGVNNHEDDFAWKSLEVL